MTPCGEWSLADELCLNPFPRSVSMSLHFRKLKKGEFKLRPQ